MPFHWPLDVVALTPASCGATLWQQAGAYALTLVAKATFSLVSDSPARLTTPQPIVPVDRAARHGASLEAASDLAPYLPTTGVVLAGHARAPGGRPVPVVPVRLAVFRDGRALLDKSLQVVGFWPRGSNQPMAFQDMPIVYERAWGGPDVEENPVGTGAWPGSPLPNILPSTGHPAPIGLGPVPRAWIARRRFLAGQDPSSLERPLVVVPEAIDFRYFHGAPADQQIELLRRDEWLVLEGLSPDYPRLRSHLPSPRAEARVYVGGTGGGVFPLELVADTLLIDGDSLVVSVVFRNHLRLDSVDSKLSNPHLLLGRMRAFAGVESPGYTITWPTPEELAKAHPDLVWTTIGGPKLEPTSPSKSITAVDPGEPKSSHQVLPFVPPPEVKAARAVGPPNSNFDQAESTLVGEPVAQFRNVLPFVASQEANPVGTFVAKGPSLVTPSSVPSLVPQDEESAETALTAVPVHASSDALPFRLKAAPPTTGGTPPSDDTSSVGAPFPIARPRQGPEEQREAIPGAPWARPLEQASIDVPRPRASRSEVPVSSWAVPSPSLGGYGSSFADPPSLAAEPAPPPVVPPPVVHEPPPEPPQLVAKGTPPKGTNVSTEGARGKGGDVRAAIAAGANIEELDLAGKDLSGLDMRGLSLSGKNLRGANLSRASLQEAKLRGTDLSDTNLSDAVLTGADLSKADLARAQGTGPVFDGAVLSGVTGTSAQFTGASFMDVQAEESSWERASLPQSKWRSAKLRGANFGRTRLDGADFSNADLTDASLGRATGERVVLTGAVLERADLRRATLPFAEMVNARFTNGFADKGDLSKAMMKGVDLQGTSLRGAVLNGAVLARARVDGADLRETDLEGANLFAVEKKDAKMTGARTNGITDIDPDVT